MVYADSLVQGAGGGGGGGRAMRHYWFLPKRAPWRLLCFPRSADWVKRAVSPPARPLPAVCTAIGRVAMEKR